MNLHFRAWVEAQQQLTIGYAKLNSGEDNMASINAVLGWLKEVNGLSEDGLELQGGKVVIVNPASGGGGAGDCPTC